MIVMPEPFTTLGLAKSASDIVKEALEFARASKNADLAEKLIDAYRNIVELDDSNRQLKRENEKLQDKIAELEKRPELASKLRYDPTDVGSYFLSKDGKEDGPFCPVCWDVDSRLVRQYRSGMSGKGVSCAYCISGARKSP